jgi:hypothetical protein
MEDETTTAAPVETGGETPQPATTEQTTAVQTTETEQQTEEQTTEPSEDEQLNKFAQTKGLELDSENAKKAAKMAMEAERNMHKATGRATELEKTMSTMSDESAKQVAEQTGQDPEVLKRLQRMEVKDSIRDFWSDNPDAKQYEKEMAKIALESGLYGSPEAILKASYAIALSGSSDTVKSQAKREALESLAQKQQAAVPTGHATTSGVPKGKSFGDLSIPEMEAKLGFVRR